MVALWRYVGNGQNETVILALKRFIHGKMSAGHSLAWSGYGTRSICRATKQAIFHQMGARHLQYRVPQLLSIRRNDDTTHAFLTRKVLLRPAHVRIFGQPQPVINAN